MNKRRSFMKSAMSLGAGAAMGAMAAGAAPGDRTAGPGGIRLGNLYFSSGLTGVRPEARKDPLAFGGDIKEQTHTILKAHRANLESMGSSLEKVLKVTVFLADVKTEKAAMNEVYAQYFPKEAPARSYGGSAVPGYGHPPRNRAGGVGFVGLINSNWRRWLRRIRSTLEFDYESGTPPRMGRGRGSALRSLRFHTCHRCAREWSPQISGCAPFVPVMETADLRESYHASKFWRLHSPRFRRVLAQCECVLDS